MATDRLSPSRSDSLKFLSDEASDGEWAVFDDRGTLEIGHAESLGQRPCIVGWPGFDSCDKPMGERRANAFFIVALVNAFRAGELAARSETQPKDEGYPGIAHDLETMRGAAEEAATLIADMQPNPGSNHARVLLKLDRALKNAAPQASPGSISGEAKSRIADVPAVAAPGFDKNERVSTHWQGCGLDGGHRHYECLQREYRELSAKSANRRSDWRRRAEAEILASNVPIQGKYVGEILDIVDEAIKAPPTPELREVLDRYDRIVASAPVDDAEWDFVMTAAEYRMIRGTG